MKRIHDSIPSLVITFFLAVLAAGCVKTSETEAPLLPAEGGGPVRVSFTVNVPDAVRSPGTRAADNDYLLAGQAGENEVNRITLFLVGVSQGNELRGRDVVSSSQTISSDHKNDAVHACTINTVGTGAIRQHIYIGANLTDAQISAFAAGNPITSSATTATGVLDEVMDFSNGNDGSGDGCNIAMFTRVKNPVLSPDAADPYLFQLTGNDNLNGTGGNTQTITLERVVSKVLLTFSLETKTYYPNNRATTVTDNIIFKRGSGLSSWGTNVAWCTLDDVRYAILPVGRRFFLDGEAAPDNASEFLTINEDNRPASSDGRTLWVNDPFAAAPPAPLAYDASRLKDSAASADPATHYCEGIYTWESLWTNDISTPSSLGLGLETVDEAMRGLVPSLVIRMKIVPARLHRDPSNVSERNNITTRATAESYLDDGSFYFYVGPLNDENHQGFYTTETYEAALMLPDYGPSDFVLYEHGYCYYWTFINAPSLDANGAQTFAGSTGSVVGLGRNAYYILNVPEAVLPGAPTLASAFLLANLADYPFGGDPLITHYLAGHEYIEMGDGLKWATCNLGAANPWEAGDYFEWGSVQPNYQEGHSQHSPCSSWIDGKNGYNWSSYTFMATGQSDGLHITKYTFDDGQVNGIWYDGETFIGDGMSSLADGNYDDDAARQQWQGTWRIPTAAEWNTLLDRDNYSWSWTDDYLGTGVKGYLVTRLTGPFQGNFIFFPVTGYRRDSNILATGYGEYWSSSLSPDHAHQASYLDFNSSFSRLSTFSDRINGLAIRPVSN